MNVAFIPVRGGSKSIPLKNIKNICGKPLVFWTVRAACECKYIDKVYIATDSQIISNTVNSIKKDKLISNSFKIEVIGRSPESASDTASTECAMLEFAQQFLFDNIVLIQATSPLLQSSDLDKGFAAFNTDNTDSVLSVVRQKRFLWNETENGYASPMNYDVFCRPRRQEFSGYFVENGAFYISSRKALLSSKNRLSGNIKTVEMEEESFWEIDEPTDWIVVENIMKQKELFERNRNTPSIEMFLSDCDGCLTDGGMYYSERGDELKKFNTKDGMGFQILKEHGVITGIITSEEMELNQRRAEKLKLNIIESGCKNKKSAIEKYSKKYGIDPKHICYIGDDINDVEAMKSFGYSCCPKDAVREVIEVADFVTSANGGDGVIREVAEHLLAIGAVK